MWVKYESLKIFMYLIGSVRGDARDEEGSSRMQEYGGQHAVGGQIDSIICIYG